MNLVTPRGAVPQIDELEEAPLSASLGHWRISGTTSRVLRGEQLTREAVLLTFCDPLPERCSRLLTLSSKEWARLKHWLDISGLALYFFNRLEELNINDLLPPTMFTRLHEDLINNTARTHGMISESIGIQQ
jgi:hypothetical protein